MQLTRQIPAPGVVGQVLAPRAFMNGGLFIEEELRLLGQPVSSFQRSPVYGCAESLVRVVQPGPFANTGEGVRAGRGMNLLVAEQL